MKVVVQADPTGVASASSAIQAAIAEASAAAGPPVVSFPPGRFLLTSPITIAQSGLALVGAGRAATTLIADTAGPAILINDGTPPAPVSRVLIRDFAVEVVSGAVSTGILQLNNAPRISVTNLHLYPQLGSDRTVWYDGIATSQGTGGLIDGVLVDGMVKSGIYIARGSFAMIVSNCEVMHSGVGGTHTFPGFTVTGCEQITFVNCNSHDNTGEGMFIGADGPVGMLPALAARQIIVSGGVFSDNGQEAGVISESLGGIVILSGYFNVEAQPANIRLDGCTVQRGSVDGVRIEAGSSIVLNAVRAVDNGLNGIAIDGYAPSHPDVVRVQGVWIGQSEVINNGNGWFADPVAGLWIRQAANIKVSGARFFASNPVSRQKLPIEIVSAGDTPSYGATASLDL